MTPCQNTSDSNIVLMTLLLWQAGPEFGSREVSVCVLNTEESAEPVPGIVQRPRGEAAQAGLQKGPFQGQPVLVLPSHPHFLKTPH